MLIDESERNFKVGIIVTATVVNVKNSVLCKLDNGLDAYVDKKNIENSDNLQDTLQ